MLETILITFFVFAYAALAWRRFNIALSLLFLLLPAYLIRFEIGPLPTTLLEAMIWVIILVWLVKNWRQLPHSIFAWLLSRQNRSLVIAVALFLLGATLAVFTSAHTRAALGEWKAFYIEPVLLFLVLTTVFIKKGSSGDSQERLASNPPDLILLSLIAGALATSALAIYQHYTGWLVPHAFWANRNTYRVTAWYGFPNAVGLFLAPIVPLSAYLVKQSWTRLKKESAGARFKHWAALATSLIFIPASLLAILFARSTGGLVGITAGAGVLLLICRKTRYWAAALGVIGLIGIILTPGINPIKQELLMQDRSGKLRLDMWAETSSFLMERPLAGAGLASYSTLIYPYRIDKWIEVFHHPHNIFLTMWVNIGLIGLAGFVWIVVWFYRVGFGGLKAGKTNLLPFVISAMTVWLTTGLVDSPYIKNDLSVLFWLLPALLVYAGQKNSGG